MKDFEQIIEALLFASPEPLTQKKINTIFDADPPDLDKYTEKLKKKYQKNDNAFEILNVAGGYQIEQGRNMTFLLGD